MRQSFCITGCRMKDSIVVFAYIVLQWVSTSSKFFFDTRWEWCIIISQCTCTIESLALLAYVSQVLTHPLIYPPSEIPGKTPMGIVSFFHSIFARSHATSRVLLSISNRSECTSHILLDEHHLRFIPSFVILIEWGYENGLDTGWPIQSYLLCLQTTSHQSKHQHDTTTEWLICYVL